FWESFLAIVIGTTLGGISQGLLSQEGPLFGVPQMVLSRLGFGYWGNVLPAGLNSITAGIGWFAVNSVSATFALNTLTHLAKPACLVIVVLVQVVVAFFGHNLVNVFERYAFPVLTIIFLIASVVVLSKAHPGAPHKTIPGAFLITLGASFGYAVGWNPYASDYTRYLKPAVSKTAVAGWAFLGLFLSCVLLETVGAAAATVISPGAALGNNPTGAFTGLMATPLADVTLLAICLGGISANALNIYSGAMSFVAMGIRLPLALRRALVAVVFGIIGFIVALTGLHDAATKYNNFLLVIAYWIAPWLAVTFCSRLRRRNRTPAELEPLLFDKKYTDWAGPVAMLAGVVVSIIFFSNQTEYVGVVPKHVGSAGDLTFEVGFVLTAVIYLGWHAVTDRRRAAAV
ncbi:MAG TPA: cytosine permease, partial [Streptosporangiaceae bacterium]